MEGVFPFTASMDGEAIKAFLIDLSGRGCGGPGWGSDGKRLRSYGKDCAPARRDPPPGEARPPVIGRRRRQVKILLNKQRDAERHARNHRLIVHGAIMEGVFPFTASMDGEAIKAFLIDISRLPGATEAAEKAQKTAPTN